MLQQQKLSSLFTASGDDQPLFVSRQMGAANGKKIGSPMTYMGYAIQSFVNALELEGLLGDATAHTHRFRMTVARLAALALVDAPAVLFDLLGHDNFETTLGYMFSDPEARAEILEVARATEYALTKDVVEALPSAAGPAAPKMREALEHFRVQTGKERFDTETLDEAVEVLMLAGAPFQIVRKGVLCTKGAGQVGACSSGRSLPNPAACRTHCVHRLELASAKAQVNETIQYLLSKIEGADVSEMLRASFEGQLLMQLRRFDDVREQWISASTTVRAIWRD
jgi:hypothetical protein